MVTHDIDRRATSHARLLLLARAILGLTLLATAAGILFAVLDAQLANEGSSPTLSELPFAIAFVAFPVVGYVLASRRPENAISWLICGVGATFALDMLMGSYAGYAVHGGLGGPRLGKLIAAIESPMWVPIVALRPRF